jgi:hypothetical protein
MELKIVPFDHKQPTRVPVSSANWARFTHDFGLLDYLILAWLVGWSLYATVACIAQVTSPLPS